MATYFKTVEDYLEYVPDVFPINLSWYEGSTDTVRTISEWQNIRFQVELGGALAPSMAEVKV